MKMICAVVAFYCAALLSTSVQAQTNFTADERDAIIAHGPWPQAIPPDPGNELSGLSWAEELGEVLFFDQTLSKDNAISCGSCHNPALGFADARPVAVGAQTAVRNTQSLFDVGLQRWFGWGGGTDSIWAASIRPMLAEHEMANTVPQLGSSLRRNQHFMLEIRQRLPTLFPALANDHQIVVLAAKSIAAYTRTLQSDRTPFDQFRDALVTGDLATQSVYSESAKRGLKLFFGEAKCNVCHFGANFSNGEFHDTGRPFFTAVGRIDPGRHSGIQRVKNDPYNLLNGFAVGVNSAEKLKTISVKLGQVNWGQWRTPTLRGLAQTAPYQHDGSLATLRDVIDAYADIDPDRLHAAGESILKPLSLDEEQRDDLVAFLMSLSVPDK